MSSSKFVGVLAACSVLAMLVACTPSGSTPTSTRHDATSTATPAPTFRITEVSDTGASTGTGASATDAPTDTATTTSASPATDGAADATTGTVADSGADYSFTAGNRLGLSVDGGTLTTVSITDTKHPKLAVDPGVFVDAQGTALEATDANAGSSTTPEPTTDTSSDAGTEPSTAATDSTPSPSASAKDESTITAPDDATGWTSEFDLVGDSTYELTATATSPDGAEHTFTQNVEVGAASGNPMSVRTVLADDQTVGVAAPIILTFGSTVAKEYRDDVQRRLSVTVTDDNGKKRKVTGSWGWLPNDPESRLHFRPKEYWPAHSKVSVDAPLKNVPMAEGRIGQNDLTLDFEIGRKQVVEASAKTHRMIVTRDGKEIMNFPASLGAPKAPSYNGIHVVMGKAADYTMTSAKWGYTTPVQWAVRIHNNGEFVHAAPWSVGVQGSQNVSHGCINLSTARAKEYYDTAIYGDPVVISGSSVDLTTSQSDISDWVYSWDQWKKLSALD